MYDSVKHFLCFFFYLEKNHVSIYLAKLLKVHINVMFAKTIPYGTHPSKSRYGNHVPDAPQDSTVCSVIPTG